MLGELQLDQITELGHSSLSTTQIYAHASKDHRRSAIDMLVPREK